MEERGFELSWWLFCCWPLLLLFLESLLPLARLVRTGDETDEKEGVSLCHFLSFSVCCSGGLELVPDEALGESEVANGE